MKKILIALLIVMSGIAGNGQEWTESMDNPDVPVLKSRSGFDKYFQNKNINEKGNGWKPYNRWENFWLERDVTGPIRLHADAMWKAHLELKNQVSQSPVIANWRTLGPFDVPSSGGGAGRLNCVAFHPTDPNIMLVGAPAGGIWITKDGGNTWSTNTDDLPSIGISDIVFDPNNPDIIYAGTGDGDGGDTYSFGILKSVDGGQSWDSTGFTFDYAQGRTVNKILINPLNSNSLLAATSYAMYKSYDGGQNWQLARMANFKDMEYKPGDTSIVHAVSTNRLYRSSNGGETFTTNNALSLPSNISRLSIAVTPIASDYIYILASNSSDNGYAGLYRSVDGGSTFQLRSDYPNILGWSTDGSDNGGQGWYDLALAVSPSNKNFVYVGGVNIWRSVNGGAAWNQIAHWYGGGGNPYVHADIHEIEFYPGSGTEIYACTDGGLFYSPNAGNNWGDKSDGLSIGQLYRLGTAGNSSSLVITGWQDNGSNLYSAPFWTRVIGGDGMECAIDYNNPNIIYGSLYYGNIRRSMDGGVNWDEITASVSESGGWVTPFVLHPSDPSKLFAGFKNVWRASNYGNNWTKISNFSGSSNLDALAVAPSDASVIYTSTSSAIYKTTNGGTTWINISSGLPNRKISYIAVHPEDPTILWLTLTGFTSNQKVYFSDDGGQNWNNISTGLPNLPANCIAYEPYADGLYIGTDIGVYYKDSTMSQWEPFMEGLPNVIVRELEIVSNEGKIVAATYGRGLWESEIFPYSDIKEDFVEGEIKLFPNPATDVITIETGIHYSGNIALSAYDMSGKEVISIKKSGLEPRMTLDISKLSKGMFLLRIQGENMLWKSSFIHQ